MGHSIAAIGGAMGSAGLVTAGTGIIRREVVGHVERRSSGDGEGIVFVASTDDVDRYGDIIDQRSWRLDRYQANPVVQVDHHYSVSATVARGHAELLDGRLMLTIERWASTPLAREVSEKVADGILSAVSVGFRPGRVVERARLPADSPYGGERGLVYYDCELLEVSLVAIPANPYALAAGLDAWAGDTDEARARLTHVDVAQAVLTACERDPCYRRRMAALLLAAPNDAALLLAAPNNDAGHGAPSPPVPNMSITEWMSR